MTNLTHLSLCTGIGGIDLAAEWAGFVTVGQCEIDEYASKVLTKNFKGVPNLHDIRTVNNSRLREVGIDPEAITLMSAGFPCQPYSLAGKGRGDGDSRDLWGEVKRCIAEIRPRWFVGENTPGLFARANQRYFKRILADLAEMGYSVSWGIWGACDVGAPHKRERVFIVAYSNGERRHIYEQNRRTACKKVGERKNKAKTLIGAGSICGAISNTRGGRQRTQKNQIPTRRDSVINSSWWQTEPDVGRVVDGCPARVDKLRCLGNAVVPQQIYPLLKAIADYEKEQI